jgi:hypothetical protein
MTSCPIRFWSSLYSAIFTFFVPALYKCLKLSELFSD